MKYFVRKAAVLTVLTALMIMSGCPNTISVTEKKDTTAPKEVTAFKTIAGNGKISLSWTNPADEDLYQVELSVSPAAGSLASPVYLAAEKGKAMSFTAEGLTNGTGYTFTVKTIDKALNKSSGVSTKEAVKPIDTSDKTAPSEVTDLQAVAGNGKISLSWTNPADEDLYQVELSVSPAAGSLASPVYLAAEKGKAMSFTAEGLTNGTEYTFTVKTIDKSLNTGKAVTVKATPKSSGAGGTVDTTAPAEVTELKAVAGNGKISLSWKNPADEDLYQVEITASPAAGSLASPVYLAAQKGAAGGFIAEGLANDTEYTFTVKTIDRVLNKSTGVTTEKVQTLPAGSPMTLSLSQSPEKTVWTNGSVTISFTSSTSIKTAKWIKGVKTLKEIFASGTEISGTNFTVAENGIYSVAVQDNEGRREVETIEITNIDKTAPQKPTNLAAEYKLSAKKIVLKWTDPADSESGLKELTLTYTINGANATTQTIAKGKQTLEITGVEPQGLPYAFSLKGIDNVGNECPAAMVTITPSAQAEVTAIRLDRTHLDTLMTNRDIPVTITGSNFDKLESLLVQVFDGSTGYSPVTAVIDKPNNTATATVRAPMPSHPTDEGTTYTVKAIVNSTTPAEATASFKVSKPAQVTNMTLTPHQLAVNSAIKTSAKVTGTNFNIRGETQIKLLDSSGDEVTGSTVTVPADTGNATGFTAELTLPTESGVYTAAVYFNGVKETVTSTLQLYGSPEITSVSLPKAGTGYGGNKLPVRITGKNFTASGISAASFTGTSVLSDIKIESDTLVTAKVSCPYEAGESNLTVTCTPQSGAAVTGTGNIIVKDYSSYTVGKIVLKKGNLVEKDSYSSIDSSNPPVAVIAGVNGYGRAIGIGLHVSQSSLMWAKSGTAGYNTKFEGIVCTPSATGSGAAATASFEGNTDGSDNWEYIRSIDPEGTADAATNYPAFHWVNEYNTTYATQLAGTTFVWYMPSLAELCEVYKHKDTINGSLAKIHGLNNGAADNGLGTSYYWSSSQHASSNIYAWLVYFYNGYVDYYSKSNNNRVCCLTGL